MINTIQMAGLYFDFKVFNLSMPNATAVAIASGQISAPNSTYAAPALPNGGMPSTRFHVQNPSPNSDPQIGFIKGIFETAPATSGAIVPASNATNENIGAFKKPRDFCISATSALIAPSPGIHRIHRIALGPKVVVEIVKKIVITRSNGNSVHTTIVAVILIQFQKVPISNKN